VLPIDFVMDPAYLQIRYLEATTRRHSLLGAAGAVIRGQEFHKSRVAGSALAPSFFTAKTSDGREFVDGYQHRNIVATFAHLYFKSYPGAAQSFLNAARNFRATVAFLGEAT